MKIPDRQAQCVAFPSKRPEAIHSHEALHPRSLSTCSKISCLFQHASQIASNLFCAISLCLLGNSLKMLSNDNDSLHSCPNIQISKKQLEIFQRCSTAVTESGKHSMVLSSVTSHYAIMSFHLLMVSEHLLVNTHKSLSTNFTRSQWQKLPC